MDKNRKSGHNDNFRRTWNIEDYKPKEKVKSAKIKNEFSKDQVIKREKLKAREYLLDLDKSVGKTRLVKGATDPATAGGYFCDVCQVVINDSINFLDHINGIKHQKVLNMNMKVERSTLDQVKARLENIQKEKEKKNVEQNLTFEERVMKAKLKVSVLKYRKKKRKKRKN